MAETISIHAAGGGTARHFQPRSPAANVGIIGIHGPEATACIQIFVEAGMPLTAWTRRPDSAWAKRLACRGVAVRRFDAAHQPVEPEPAVARLDWLLICPGQRLGRPTDVTPIDDACWPTAPGRVLELVPAGMPAARRLPERGVLRLPTAVVLERWFDTPMRRNIRRGLLPVPRRGVRALRLISAHEIARVVLAVCRDALSVEAATARLDGHRTPIPEVLAACRSQVDRAVRPQHRSAAAFSLRVGREWALMAPWICDPRRTDDPRDDENCAMLDSMVDRIRRLSW